MKRNDFELLLPVGQKEMAEAAIQNGADAIYVGFPGFNARGRSYDFELNELRQIIEMCHLNGVKVNLAFNIVIFENELPKVVEAINQVLPLKPDALIVQDLGLVKIIKKMFPEQTVHASTQMTITNDLAIRQVENLDIQRFVLGRENSLSEIKLIAERTKRELEVFVHGALCVSYSGQCFTSETLGGRSANRGQCAQSCRFSYDLIVDDEKKDLVDRNYLVSPQDLCGIAEIPELMKLGVKSFKVEGRLKSPEYVAQVAKSFRRVIDKNLAGSLLSNRELDEEKSKMSVEYSRGFFPGWLHGVNHQELVEGTYSSHRGLEIGTITSVAGSKLTFSSKIQNLDVESGDGLAWFIGKEKFGAGIYSVLNFGEEYTVEFSNTVKVASDAVGAKLYLNHDKSQKKQIEKSLTDRENKRRIPIKLKIKLEVDKPMQVNLRDDRFEITGETVSAAVPAQKKPIGYAALFEEFSSVGAGVFSLASEDFKLEIVQNAELFLNHKEIKQLRQSMYQQLEELRKNNKISKAGEVRPVEASALLDFGKHLSKSVDLKMPALNILLRNKQQVIDLLTAISDGRLNSAEIASVCLDFEFGRDYLTSAEMLKNSGIKFGLATTRILKPEENNNLKAIHAINPDFILIRNLGAIYYFNHVQKFEGELRGDFSLNVTNRHTFNYLKDAGLKSICLSYDLNLDQSLALLENVDSSAAEITIHQSMPSFHMEHCVFAAFLSKGKSYRDCGKPCEKHKVQLVDQFGNRHWIKPDQECRNTMYNASAQTALPYLEMWKNQGLGSIRFEALHESGDQLIDKIAVYANVLNERESIDNGLQALQTQESYGLSPRQLARNVEYQARKKDHSFLK